ncbi:MAG: nucleotide sugar dehydrogenase [Dehalococcoidia bacterium]|jgi:UDP-N-acetyl-D-glucosamine dehydrogenase
MTKIEEKIQNKTAKIGIIGLGYVGMPLAIAFAEAGFKVVGFDAQQAKVDAVNKGKSDIADIADERLAPLLASESIEATGNMARLGEADAVCICVPTPLTNTKEPDLSFVKGVSQDLAQRLRPGQLIILESTTYPGTTREVILPILQRSGLEVDKEFYLAFSPERIDPGNNKYNIKNTPKIVGGISPVSTGVAAMLYRQVADNVVVVTSSEAAEMTKVFENVFRSVNIALVNQMAQLCEKMGVSIWEVIESAATKPFGYMPFYPGPGIGGHCIPLDPYYLANKAREYDFHISFIELAAEINESMPYYVVARVMEALNEGGKALKGAKVLVLGVAYKKDSADIRESPSLKIIELLHNKGAQVSYSDPYVKKINNSAGNWESVSLTQKNLSSADCVLIATDHSCFDLDRIAAWSKLIFDTRGVTRHLKDHPGIIRLGESRKQFFSAGSQP